jgi:hypothetical protein
VEVLLAEEEEDKQMMMFDFQFVQGLIANYY